MERSVILGPASALKTRKNAQRAFEPFLARVNAVDYRPGKFARLGDFVDVWTREVLQHQKPSSIKAVQSHLRTYIRPWLANVRLEEFTAQAQQNFVTRLSQRVSRKSVINIVGTLGSILRTARSWGYVCHRVNTGELVFPAEAVRKEPRCFTAHEVQQIIAIAAQPYRTMFAIAAMTGLRAGEVLGLQWTDMDFARGLIHVRRSAWYGHIQTTKSKTSTAPVPLPEPLAVVLHDYEKQWRPNPHGFLFVTRKSRPPSSNNVVERGLWPVLDALRIPRCGLHAFRHTHASLLIDVGANAKVAQQQMRHADARTTLETYGHVVGNAQREAVSKVGELVCPDAKFCAQMRPN